MKQNYIILLAAVAMMLVGCKTTEQNYKNAYEVAKENSRNKVDDVTDARIAAEKGVPQVQLAGVEVNMLTSPFSVVDRDEATDAQVGKYSVIVGRFKQIFNARMFRDRLRGKEYPAYVVENPEKEYFVAARGFATAEEAAAYIKNIDKIIPFAVPIKPFVLKRP